MLGLVGGAQAQEVRLGRPRAHGRGGGAATPWHERVGESEAAVGGAAAESVGVVTAHG